VCLGGALGSGARYLVATWVARAVGPGLPWGTWAVNVIGCFTIEFVMRAAARTQMAPLAVLALTTGVLGGFTTYSAFNNQVLELVRGGGWGGPLYLGATLAGCLLAGLAGLALGQVIWPAR
jgi:CrcB protein